MHLSQTALLLAMPLMVCRSGIHVPEGGGRPVGIERQRSGKIKTKTTKTPDEQAVAQQDKPPPAAKAPKPTPPPKRVAARPPKPAPPAKRAAAPPNPTAPSPNLCAGLKPQLELPTKMSSGERKPFSDAVQDNMSEIEDCYKEARVRDPAVEGCVYASVTVDRIGHLQMPSVGASNIQDPAMLECITDALHVMQLRAPYDEVVWVVLYPFFFEQGRIFHSSQHLRGA